MLPRVIKLAAAGAFVGGAVGALSSLAKPRLPTLHRTDDPDLHKRIINLKYAPDASEALERLSDYKTLDAAAYDDLRVNVDRLVGIFILVSAKGPVDASYEVKAYRYRRNVELAMERLLKKYHNGQPSKQLADDMDSLFKCVDNYLYNIRQTMHEKFAAREINPK